MKILILASTYPRSAHDTLPGFVHELSRRIAALGHEVDVLTPHLPGTAEIDTMDGVRIKRFRYCLESLEGLAGSGGIVSRLRERPLRLFLVPLFLIANALALRAQLRRNAYDIVHAHWLIPQGLLACAIAPLAGNVPVICTAHGGDLFALRAKAFRALRRFIIRRSACVTVVSRYMREVLLAEGASATKIEVASMGVDLSSRFVPVAGVERDPNHVIFVGRLVEKKGVKILLDAFREVLTVCPVAHLTIVGDGPERPTLEAQAARLELGDAIRFLGAQPQAALPALYSSASIAVVPSIVDRLGDQEGLGLVTLEAIGCGCAVVASGLQAIRDVIVQGETGLLVAAGNCSALATGILELLNSAEYRARLAAARNSPVILNFDWSGVAADYVARFRRVIADCSQSSVRVGRNRR